MKIYSVYAKKDKDDVILIQEGFNWMAAVVPIFWTCYYRIWWLLCIIIISNGLQNFIFELNLQYLSYMTYIVMVLLLGLLGNDIFIYDLVRRGYTLEEIIVAESTKKALLRYYSINNKKIII